MKIKNLSRHASAASVRPYPKRTKSCSSATGPQRGLSYFPVTYRLSTPLSRRKRYGASANTWMFPPLQGEGQGGDGVRSYSSSTRPQRDLRNAQVTPLELLSLWRVAEGSLRGCLETPFAAIPSESFADKAAGAKRSEA